MELNEKNLSVTHQTGTSSLARAEATPTIVREETESQIVPTPVALNDRIFSLDVIRGVALLGILLVNIENFAAPEALHDIPVGTPIAAFSGPRAQLHLIILMLAAVGRTALSNYLLTSILCQFLFLWGPWKLYGKLEYYQYNYVVLVIWMINFIGSTLWLRAFRFGPMEWVWRSLTYLKLQPMRINPSVPAS